MGLFCLFSLLEFGCESVAPLIDAVCKVKRSVCNAKSVELSLHRKDAIAFSVFDHEADLASFDDAACCAFEREDSHLDGLPGSVEGFVRCEK